ncbi:unnamed protein product [Durusdinium trenchii]|uniref:Uncharacterized protein n=2 Tax=Durusdinium trenchii TaxID=1381693 RepID=A0ABP0LTN6_9DINO
MARTVVRQGADEAESKSANGAKSAEAAVQELVNTHGQDLLQPEQNRLLSPFQIFFSQNHIRSEFQDGRAVDLAVQSIRSSRISASEDPQYEDFGVPTDSDWWLLQPEFPEIEVILWRIKLREEDGSQLFDQEGNELYGDREWYTLDNRRLYCLQRAAVSLYPKEVRILVKVVRQEDGSCREFRKFRSTDRGRSIRLGHKDSPDLPRWCWRLEVGLCEELLPAGSPLPRQGRRRERQGWMRRQKRAGARDDESETTWGQHLANASLFVLVYAAMRLILAVWRFYLSDVPRPPIST